MPKDESVEVPMPPLIGVQKLGQPVPLSNFVLEAKTALPSAAQTKVHLRCSLSSAEVNGRSVPSSRRM